jgi:hypothetical protein
MHGTIEGNVAPDVEEMEYETGGHQGAARRRRRIEHGVIAALVVVVLAAIALIGFQSGADEEQDRSTGRPSGTASATTTEAPATTAIPASENPGDPATPPQPPAEPVHENEQAPAVLEDGKHPVHLTGLDTAGGTLELDLVQWLTDDAATDYVEAHPDEYPLVVNENPRLRTLPLSDQPQVVVVYSEAAGYEVFPHTIELAELPGYLESHGGAVEVEGALSNSVFWLTVHGGEIVAIEEQFSS